MKTVEGLLEEVACEIERREKYQTLLEEGNDRERLFFHLYRGDLGYFEGLFGQFEKFSEEQAHSLAVLFENVLMEFAQYRADPQVLHCLHRAQRNDREPEPTAAGEWGRYVLRLYAAVCGQEREYTDNWIDTLTDKIRQCVLTQYGNGDLNVAWIARQFHYTANYVSKVFCDRTGMPLSDFIIETRMSKAAQLLRDTRLDIGEIARMVGYSDANYFAKAFRKQLGISPTVYRKNFL